jgi:hypothetical protein
MIKTIQKAMAMQGAISVVEMIALYSMLCDRYATDFRSGVCLDLGSAYGKSSFVAASAIDKVCERTSEDVSFVMTDPAYKVNINRIEVKNHFILNVSTNVKIYDSPSLDVIAKHEDIVYAFIDSGAHEFDMINAELNALLPRLRKEALVFLHDFGNQYQGVEKAYFEWVKPGTGLTHNPIDWPKHIEQMKRMGLSEKDNNTWHTYDHLDDPMFMACLRRE